MTFAVGLLMAGVLALPVAAETVKIATWNIEHLRDTDGEGRRRRTEDDYRRLRDYARILDADVIAVQEVENAQALGRVFNQDKYRFFISKRRHAQRTAFAVRNSIPVTHNSDLKALNTTGGLRHGVDIEITLGGWNIRLLSIHLKAFCFVSSVTSPQKKDCRKLARQIPVLERWIDGRAAAGRPLVVLGDFNRRFGAEGDDFWPEIDDGHPAQLKLFRATAGAKAKCNPKYPLFIDHIVYDRLVSRWVVPGSFQELVYAASDKNRALSDHCPISMRLEIKPN